MTPPGTYVGVDVSKGALDVHVRPGGESFAAANDPAGLADLAARLAPRRPALVVLEATGGYEHAAAAAPVRKSLQAHIAWLSRQLSQVDGALAAAVQASPVWRAKDELLQSIKRIGPTASRTLLAALPELGTLTRQRIAALAGLAPLNWDSGRWRGPRSIGGGRAAVWSALYLGALSAARYNPALRAFSERLRQAGKAAKVRLSGSAEGF